MFNIINSVSAALLWVVFQSLAFVLPGNPFGSAFLFFAPVVSLASQRLSFRLLGRRLTLLILVAANVAILSRITNTTYTIATWLAVCNMGHALVDLYGLIGFAWYTALFNIIACHESYVVSICLAAYLMVTFHVVISGRPLLSCFTIVVTTVQRGVFLINVAVRFIIILTIAYGMYRFSVSKEYNDALFGSPGGVCLKLDCLGVYRYAFNTLMYVVVAALAMHTIEDIRCFYAPSLGRAPARVAVAGQLGTGRTSFSCDQVAALAKLEAELYSADLRLLGPPDTQ